MIFRQANPYYKMTRHFEDAGLGKDLIPTDKYKVLIWPLYAVWNHFKPHPYMCGSFRSGALTVRGPSG